MATRQLALADAPARRVVPPRNAGGPIRVDWLDPIKAFALIGIMLDHLVETFGHGPWFTNPGWDWPATLSERLHTFWPDGPSTAWNTVRFLGWLGDNAPGVFIIASGVGLTLGALRLTAAERAASGYVRSFYERRLARIYPLYWGMHVVILGLAIFVSVVSLTFATPATLLSLIGLRITRGLFFYISPAWWFVWLILQLYAVYPFLVRALDRWGPARFLAFAVGVEIVSRAIGLALPPIRYYWLMGMFAGSRVGEFAVGMVIATWLTRAHADRRPEPRATLIGAWGAAAYAAGLVASFWTVGALISNLLIAVGMGGLFYAAWHAVRRTSATMARGVTAFGVASYGVFLVHQAPLTWVSRIYADRPSLHLAAALAVLALSVPVAGWIERATERVRVGGPAALMRHVGPTTTALAIAVMLILFAGRPQVTVDGHVDRALAWVAAVSTGLLLWLESLDADAPRGRRFLRRAGFTSGLLGVFVVSGDADFLAVVFGLVIAGCVTLVDGDPRPRLRPWVIGGCSAIGLFAVAEIVLGRVSPREVGGWGERPALTIHPTRAFGLTPDQVTHLRYNDYDYVIRANSFGLASPEIAAARPTPTTFRVLTMGDAFTMPEGLPYEQSYPALLQTALSRCMAPRTVQVINAGVTGYGPPEEMAQFRELGPLFAPNVVVHEFFVNDWQDITIGTEQRRRGIGLFGKGFRALLHDRSQLVANLKHWYAAAAAAVTGIPSADQQWKLMLPYFQRGPSSLYDSANVARMTAFVASMRDAARADTAAYLVFYVPAGVTVLPREMIEYLPRSGIPLSDPAHYDLLRPYAPLKAITDSLGVPLLDLTGPLRTHRPQPVYYPNAWHWTPEGHRVAAQALLAEMARRGLVPAACAP
jgi:peptidoglycan/LPS O-acetylase OafA/YrhL